MRKLIVSFFARAYARFFFFSAIFVFIDSVFSVVFDSGDTFSAEEGRRLLDSVYPGVIKSCKDPTTKENKNARNKLLDFYDMRSFAGISAYAHVHL